VFLPNETELLELSREANLDIALEKISGKMLVAVKRGALGGVAQKNNHKATASALSVNVLDTTGAGDSFDAGFIYGYLKSWNIEQSIRLACICGSLSTRGIGGTSTQPNFTEASSYLQSI
jgi:sugar/nucleoside kinase (ribokinase family)